MLKRGGILLFLITILSLRKSFGQNIDTVKTVKNTVYLNFAGQMLFSLRYDRVLVTKEYYFLTSQVDYGFIPGDNDLAEPRHRIIVTGLNNLSGQKEF